MDRPPPRRQHRSQSLTRVWTFPIHEPSMAIVNVADAVQAVHRAYVEAGDDVPLNSDAFPYLEYFVPRDLFRQVIDNVREFVPYLDSPAPAVGEMTRGGR